MLHYSCILFYQHHCQQCRYCILAKLSALPRILICMRLLKSFDGHTSPQPAPRTVKHGCDLTCNLPVSEHHLFWGTLVCRQQANSSINCAGACLQASSTGEYTYITGPYMGYITNAATSLQGPSASAPGYNLQVQTHLVKSTFAC